MVDVAHEDSVTRIGREIRSGRVSFDDGDVVESRANHGLSNFCDARRLDVRAEYTANTRRDANRKRSRARANIRYNRALVQVQNLHQPRDVHRVVWSLRIERSAV